MTDAPDHWDSYIEHYHDERAGITEDLLGRSLDETGRTAYEWLSEDVRSGCVIDTACGSAPVQTFIDGWVGLDRSAGELARARRLGRGPLVQGSATALPFADRAASASVAAMALMVVDDPRTMLDEIHRVLAPDGRLHLLVPGSRPLRLIDLARYGALIAALGTLRLAVPHPEVSDNPAELLATAGFEVLDDERRRFAYPLHGRDDAETFLEGMYTPGLSERRQRWARAVVDHWGHGEIGMPLRRLIARKVD